MIEAGYTRKTALAAAGRIFDAIRNSGALDPFVRMMEEKRKKALEEITDKKLEKQSGYSNALTLDLLTKNIQLLTGKATDRPEHQLLSDDQLNRLATQIAKRSGEEEANEDG